MRRASVLAVSGICLSVPWIASAARAEPPAETSPVPDPGAPDPGAAPADGAPPADAAAADAPPALPEPGTGAVEPAPPPAEPTPETVDAGASVDLGTDTGASASADGAATDTSTPAAPALEVGMVRGRREPAVNSLRGGLGLFHTTLADVGARNTVRFRLHTDFFRKSAFIYDSADNGADEHGRVRGTVNLGYSPLKFLRTRPSSSPSATSTSASRAPTDWSAAARSASAASSASAALWGRRCSSDKVNFNIDALFTLDVRYLTKPSVPVPLHHQHRLDPRQLAQAGTTGARSPTPTSREVSRFALGVNHSRVRMRYGVDFPIRLGKDRQFGLDPIAELAWDVSTRGRTPLFKPAGRDPSPLPRSSLWATLGLRANVISGLHLDLALDIGMVSPNFEYGPPVRPGSSSSASAGRSTRTR
jgi:hypothetical protein